MQAVFSPVLCPEGNRIATRTAIRGSTALRGVIDRLRSLQTGGIDLVEVFPAGRGEGGSKERDTEFLRLVRGRQQTVIETRLAALAALRLMLQTLYGREPFFMAIISVMPSDSQRLCVPLRFVLADLVFLEGVDIGIEIIDDGRDVMRQQPLYDSAGTRCATGM